MSRRDRLEAIRKKLSRVAPEDNLLSLVEDDSSGPTTELVLESRTLTTAGTQLQHLSHSADDAVDGLKKLQDGSFERISAPQERQLEAIVERETRPVAFVRGNNFEPLPAPWESYNVDGEDTPRARIERAIPAIGRVEIPPAFDGGKAIHVGTGFIVGPNLLMTNRHVAELFVVGVGRDSAGFWYVPQTDRAVDFRSEYNSADVARFAIADIVMIHPYWDMALFRVESLSEGVQPLKLSVSAPASLTDRQIAVVGYPARYKNPTSEEKALEDKHYGGIYGVKRVAPGEVLGQASVKGFGHSVNAMTHDSSTLPGNSGSAIIDVTNGQTIGLHFAGWTLRENYSVPMFELARDPRVVDLGLNFIGTLPTPTNDWDSYWKSADPKLETADNQTPPSTGTVSMASQQTQTWTIPINISVSVGQPIPAQDVASDADTVSRPTPHHRTVGDSVDSGEPVFRGQEGWFGPSSKEIVAKAYSKFLSTSLAKADFDWQTCISLAAASNLGYDESPRVRTVTNERWQLTNTRFIASNGTECFVTASSDTILVSFRGSAGWGDWVTDFKFIKQQTDYGSVHLGFHSAFQFVKETIEETIDAIGLNGRELVLTGHSLGGAIATIAAAEWHAKYPVRSVYTYGQPRVGNEDFKAYADQHFASRLYRVVNEDDVVTRLPAGKSYVGKLIHFKSSGDVNESAADTPTDESPMDEQDFDRIKLQLKAMKAHGSTDEQAAMESARQEGLISQFTSHKMVNYMTKIMKQL